MRLIDADKIPYEEWYAPEGDAMWEYKKQLCTTKEVINAIPTVKIKKRRAHWIDAYRGKYANPRYICSVCKKPALYQMQRCELGNWAEVQALSKYCPNCGREMIGGKDV